MISVGRSLLSVCPVLPYHILLYDVFSFDIRILLLLFRWSQLSGSSLWWQQTFMWPNTNSFKPL